MQNPLRRPKGNLPAPRDQDVERNKHNDGGYLAKDVRGHLVAMSGEFVGTFMFLYFAFAATQIASTSNFEAHPFSFSILSCVLSHVSKSAKSSHIKLEQKVLTPSLQLDTIDPNGPPTIDQILFISLGFGFSLAVTAWVFYRISGGLFNPAVTLGMV